MLDEPHKPIPVPRPYEPSHEGTTTGSEWGRIKGVDRVKLPKKSADETDSFVFRVGMKMQQLWEAEPDFWEDACAYMSRTAGYGGFAEFLAGGLRGNKRRQYIVRRGWHPSQKHSV